MTSFEPTPVATPKLAPAGGKDADNSALSDALAVEHATIYGYGIVSALSPPSVNGMVAEALEQHRQRRDDVITMLTARSVTAPVAAAGYQLPMQVASPADAVRLAVRMENDGATAWRAVIEHADTADDRAFAATALTQSAVLAARWNHVLGAWPITTSFPGGNE
ncbi:MAG: ferritin-like domain-containing protein [Mycobacterium sp.]|uniref:ferritin-like domain-containing protein n=1 Tax=Mycobacterium sp. TaxID=1785 RepID=UPI001EBABD76|nr:ferritin-like domain-containing protein [Mycobacterium sp.]MBW0019268.1 ferritin-like domain-containing protein [Mycobacterium sp.]